MTDKQDKSYEQWEVDRLVDAKVKAAIKDYDDGLWKMITNQFIIELAQVKNWIAITKFVVVAVALLFIGTLYQLFISLVNTVGLK
ncbi:MAG TPA: hypothetical protein VL020_06450 [Pseudomonadales bacterium]|nr:hypothetical protein [Pseudomonadales bacterium]